MLIGRDRLLIAPEAVQRKRLGLPAAGVVWSQRQRALRGNQRRFVVSQASQCPALAAPRRRVVGSKLEGARRGGERLVWLEQRDLRARHPDQAAAQSGARRVARSNRGSASAGRS